MEAVVLAGGLGTRLRAVVPELPKPLAPVAGRPFLSILLDQLDAQGFCRVILSVGYRHELIRAALGERHRGIELVYAVEDRPLGTGGAIRLAARQCCTGEVFVLNGDSYVAVDFAAMREAHLASHTQLTICAVAVADAGRYGRVLIKEGRVAGFAEKGAHGAAMINAGVYLFAPELVLGTDLPEAFSFERDFLERRLGQLKPLAFTTSGVFIDIGVPEDYARAETVLAVR